MKNMQNSSAGGAIPMVDLGPLHSALRADMDQAMAAVMDRGDFINGEAVRCFEDEAASYLGVKHAITVASGTDALMLALRAAGVGAGDEVITSPFTFWATAEAIEQVGATAVYVDIDPVDMNLDSRGLEAALTSRSRAILPVHIFGQCADMSAVMEVAARAGLAVIEDAAQAFGARYHGQPAGSFGTAGCFSFYPSKPLGCLGDGGLISTNDDVVADRIRRLANHGTVATNRHDCFAYNSRLDSLQAAVLSIKLRQLDEHLEERRRLAQNYQAALADLPIELPQILPGRSHCFAQYTIRLDRRDALNQYLAAAGIASAIHYPVPLYAQVAQQDRYRGLRLPEVETCSTSCLSLPLYQGLTAKQQEAVCERIASFCR